MYTHKYLAICQFLGDWESCLFAIYWDHQTAYSKFHDDCHPRGFCFCCCCFCCNCCCFDCCDCCCFGSRCVACCCFAQHERAFVLHRPGRTGPNRTRVAAVIAVVLATAAAAVAQRGAEAAVPAVVGGGVFFFEPHLRLAPIVFPLQKYLFKIKK